MLYNIVTNFWGKDMFECLRQIDERLYNRYLTVENNIKSLSNSFYDSYLDMVEEFIRFLVNKYEIDINKKLTAGKILGLKNVNEFFTQALNVDQENYEKIKNYVQKVNRHKHNNEKQISLETVFNYLREFNNLTEAYFASNNIECDIYDSEYISEIYGAYKKENELLKKEQEALQKDLKDAIENGKIREDDIASYKKLLNQSSQSNLSLEKQNDRLRRQIDKLKDIKMSILEEKLNKTIQLLNELTQSVIENRAVSYAVGDTICGSKKFKEYIEKAKKTMSSTNTIDNA